MWIEAEICAPSEAPRQTTRPDGVTRGGRGDSLPTIRTTRATVTHLLPLVSYQFNTKNNRIVKTQNHKKKCKQTTTADRTKVIDNHAAYQFFKISYFCLVADLDFFKIAVCVYLRRV